MMFESHSKVDVSELQKTAYFSRFAAAHLNAFRPHLRIGETLGKGPGIWRNIAEHCLVAGAFADLLADELQLSSSDKSDVVAAAILHDWHKKHELSAQSKYAAEGTLSEHKLSLIQEHARAELRELGIPERVIRLSHANLPNTVEGPQTLPEKILWYVDAMLSHTEPVPIKQRFSDLERGWDGVREDPARAQRNLAFSSLYTDRYRGKPLYSLQQELGLTISQELADRLNYHGDIEQLPLALKEKLQERIATQAL